MRKPESTTTGLLPGGPWWRALLESRWRDRLQLVTELSVEFHDAAAAAAPAQGTGRPGPALQRLMGRATSARRALADTDDALARLAAGRFGRCENCAVPIPARTLRAEPEARYCARCGGSAVVHSEGSLVTA
jgi:RNA polymerase-binding transcription factor DksA